MNDLEIMKSNERAFIVDGIKSKTLILGEHGLLTYWQRGRLNIRNMIKVMDIITEGTQSWLDEQSVSLSSFHSMLLYIQ